ncbi:MAG TPA: hypothetical protein VKR06_37065 [Ktedonosporobacter sp.]|nr:hypothetical protein [Ktedonosporobacter sp.]
MSVLMALLVQSGDADLPRRLIEKQSQFFEPGPSPSHGDITWPLKAARNVILDTYGDGDVLLYAITGTLRQRWEQIKYGLAPGVAHGTEIEALIPIMEFVMLFCHSFFEGSCRGSRALLAQEYDHFAGRCTVAFLDLQEERAKG